MNVNENISPEESIEGVVSTPLEDYAGMLREKILFGLQIYPFISPSMLHMFLQTATPATVWKPILHDLEAEGLVKRTEVTLTSPHERVQTYTILHLPENAYTYNASVENIAEVEPSGD